MTNYIGTDFFIRGKRLFVNYKLYYQTQCFIMDLVDYAVTNYNNCLKDETNIYL